MVRVVPACPVGTPRAAMAGLVFGILVATCAGCGGHKMLPESEPLELVEPLAAANDEAWVREAFELELSKAGVSVTTHEAIDGGAPLPHLTGDIQRLDCNLGWAYDADVWLQVTLERPGEAPVVRQYQGRGSVGLNLAGTTGAVGKSLALALRDAIGQMRTEVDMARGL